MIIYFVISISGDIKYLGLCFVLWVIGVSQALLILLLVVRNLKGKQFFSDFFVKRPKQDMGVLDMDIKQSVSYLPAEGKKNERWVNHTHLIFS